MWTYQSARTELADARAALLVCVAELIVQIRAGLHASRAVDKVCPECVPHSAEHQKADGSNAADLFRAALVDLLFLGR